MAEQIFIDPTEIVFIQSRATTNEVLIEEYAEMMQAGIEFEAACGLRDEAGQVYVYDGLHRGEAAKAVGKLLLVEVKPGPKLEAEWLALTANQKHGLRRSREDKRRVVHTALLHPYGAKLSNREIARHCGVDHKTVGKIRQELELSGEIPQIQTRTVSRAGVTYEQDTSQIGQSSSEPIEARLAVSGRLEPETVEPNGTGSANGSTHSGRDLERSTQPLSEGQIRPEPRAQEFECPRCWQERVVGVNGSRRWCLGCGTEWPTASDFLAEVSYGKGSSADSELARTQVQRRFAGILARLRDDQLDQLAVWLDELENSLTFTERKLAGSR